LTAHVERVGASEEFQSAIIDALQMHDVLAHLMSLADDFLIFSSMQAKSAFSLRLERVMLSNICNRLKMVCGTLAIEKGSTFKVTLSETLSAMPVDLALAPALACARRLALVFAHAL
jgi:hypothetical protein